MLHLFQTTSSSDVLTAEHRVIMEPSEAPVGADRFDELLRSVGAPLIIRFQTDTRHGGLSS